MSQLRWLCLAAMLVPTSVLSAQARSCGVERWPVKIGVDRDVTRLDTLPVVATIAELRALPRPPRPMPYNTRIAPHELRTFRVTAVLRQVISEDDGDWHLVLEDTAVSGATMVAEVPDPACALGSAYAGGYDAVRRDLRAAPRLAVIELVGIGFFDYLHGQRGMAPNGFELHPVIAARVVGGAVAAAPDTAAPGASKVWVNTGSNVYHCAGTRWYGATKAGYYATEQKAVASGARPAYGRKCPAR